MSLILTKNHYSITLLDSNTSRYTRLFRWLFQQLSFWKISLIQISHIHSLLTNLTMFIGVAHMELPHMLQNCSHATKKITTKQTKKKKKNCCKTDQSSFFFPLSFFFLFLFYFIFLTKVLRYLPLTFNYKLHWHRKNL